MVRLSPAERAWLVAEAKNSDVNESDIVRQLIEERMLESSEGRSEMRGFAQVGHDAVVVWSPSHMMHVHDLNTQLERGCTERGPRASFQQSGNLYYSWLNAPAGRCELCGGRCRVR